MLASEQANRGWDVHIALRRGGSNRAIIRKGEISIHPLGDLRGPHPLLLRRLGLVVHRLDPDVVQTWLPQMDIVAGLATAFSRRSWILCERSSEAAYRRKSLGAFIRRHLGQFASAVVANSHEGATYWSGNTPAGKIIAVVPNAVDIGAIRRATSPRDLPRGPQERVLLFIGRLVTEKAPEVFVDALATMGESHRLRTLMIGGGPLRSHILARISAHGLDRHVQVLQYLSDWWGLLKTAAAVVSTSRVEGQPNVVLEAMAGECPLVVSDIPQHRAILDEQSALFVPPDNPKALAHAIVSLLADPDSARARATRAFERVARFTIQATADGYERVYTEVLKGRPK